MHVLNDMFMIKVVAIPDVPILSRTLKALKISILFMDIFLYYKSVVCKLSPGHLGVQPGGRTGWGRKGDPGQQPAATRNPTGAWNLCTGPEFLVSR